MRVCFEGFDGREEGNARCWTEKQGFGVYNQRGVLHLLGKPPFVGLQVHVHETVLAAMASNEKSSYNFAFKAESTTDQSLHMPYLLP